MILHEVRLSVDHGIAADYRSWLESQIHDMLALPGFEYAELLREQGDESRAVFVAHYWMRDRDALKMYLRDHAASMRADGLRRFGNQFSAERRVLELERRIGMP